MATHPGLVREHNEDRLHADLERGIFMVIDGIGGQAGGETAAETALDLMRKRLERRTGHPEERIREAIAVANNEIFARARRTPSWAGMGCVLTVALVEDGQVSVGHVGDSRLYVLRDGGIVKITHDHSPVGEREDRGELDEEAAMRHPRRNEVYRSVGTEEHGPFDEGFVETAGFQIEPDQALLLCSDGLTDLVTSSEILKVVKSHAKDPHTVVDRLVRASLEAGGKDNVSVIFAAGPRFAAAWRRGGRSDADGASMLTRAPRSARALLDQRAVQFVLGLVSGLLIAAALAVMGRGPTTQIPMGGIDESPRPRVLEVGSGGPFRTIADALGAARAGDTVLVAPGTYREQVRLVDGVSLVGTAPRATVLVPTAEGAAVVGIVAESIHSGRISGLAIRGDDAAPLDIGIRLRDATVAVEDVEVSGARLAGIAIEGRRSAALRASWIHDNPGAGIVVRAGGTARLAHNLIQRNGRGSRTGPGVDLEPGARADLERNVIADNAGPGVRGVPPGERRSVLASNRFEPGGGPPIAPSPSSRPR